MTLEDGIRCVWDGFRKRVSFEALMFRPFTPSIIAFQLTGLLALLVCALYLCLCCGKPGLRAEQLYVINPGCARQLEEEWSAIQVVSQRTRLGGANACFCALRQERTSPRTYDITGTPSFLLVLFTCSFFLNFHTSTTSLLLPSLHLFPDPEFASIFIYHFPLRSALFLYQHSHGSVLTNPSTSIVTSLSVLRLD
jgi:hypothetical protein